MNKEKALDVLKESINDKVKQKWIDGTNVTHDIAVLVRLANVCGLINYSQAKQLFHEANSGHLLTCTFLYDLGLKNRWLYPT